MFTWLCVYVPLYIWLHTKRSHHIEHNNQFLALYFLNEVCKSTCTRMSRVYKTKHTAICFFYFFIFYCTLEDCPLCMGWCIWRKHCWRIYEGVDIPAAELKDMILRSSYFWRLDWLETRRWFLLRFFFFFFFIGKFLSPLGLEPGTSYKPFPSLYHFSQASRAWFLLRYCWW